MKRTRLLLVAGFLFIILLLLFFAWGGSDTLKPQFIPGAPKKLPPFTADHYDWNSDRLFDDDKIWFWIADRTNYHAYLYDLRQRKILGELLNAGPPETWLTDGGTSRILCIGLDSPGKLFKQKLLALAGKVFGKKWVNQANRTETFWILDLRSNKATRVGAFEQFVGTGSSWRRSPDSRHAFNVPSTAFDRSLFLCDLKENSFERIPVSWSPCGWWNDQEIILRSGDQQFDLLDIHTRKVRPLLTSAAISSFLSKADLPKDASVVSSSVWNGREYDFYLGPKDQFNGLSGTNGFLLKIERTGPSLRLVSRDFKFQWGGHFDPSGTRYLYEGERGKPGAGGDGAVYVRNLTNNTELTIVAPDNRGQYAIPRWYGDEIIYFRNRVIHRVKVDGSNPEPLLP